MSRVRRAGYLRDARSFRIGETLARNRRRATPRDAVRQWMRYAGHRSVVLGSFRHIGVHAVTTRRSSYYTAVFGTRRR